MNKIRIAIVGVGNCASSLLQGINFYQNSSGNGADVGLMHRQIGPYQPQDIEVVAAFDIDRRKVGLDAAEAIFALPNCTKVFCEKIKPTGATVMMGVGAMGMALLGTQPSTADEAHRLAGEWSPSEALWRQVIDAASLETDTARPYPFFLAHPLQAAPETLGARDAWLAEWKWDGIRAQLIHRDGATTLWSRGDEPIAGQFPEIMADAQRLPHCVLDGEILAWKDGRVMPFAALQKRLGRKDPGKKILTESPVIFLAFDLLEVDGEDWRAHPLAERRRRLRDLILAIPGETRFLVSSELRAPSWETLAEARAQSREHGTEGLMLKRLDSEYGVGRPRGAWWKWKIEPYTLDAVLIYAQPGHGKRASLFTDYTFGLWKGDELVPFAKAYSGLTDEEIREVDAFIRRNTAERFGPVRVVKPELVFELGFEGIQRSTRHKSGIAVRFPRMLRMRPDKAIREANTLQDALALIGT